MLPKTSSISVSGYCPQSIHFLCLMTQQNISKLRYLIFSCCHVGALELFFRRLWPLNRMRSFICISMETLMKKIGLDLIEWKLKNQIGCKLRDTYTKRLKIWKLLFHFFFLKKQSQTIYGDKRESVKNTDLRKLLRCSAKLAQIQNTFLYAFHYYILPSGSFVFKSLLILKK